MSQGDKTYRWDSLSILDDSASFTQHLWTCCSHYCPCASHEGIHTTAPPILNLNTIWKQVVSFRPRPSHPRGNNPWLCGPQEVVWTFERRENKSLAPARNQTLECSTVIILLRYPVTSYYSRLITKPHPACKGCRSPCWFFCLIHSVYKTCLPSWNNFYYQFFGVYVKQLLA